MRSGPYRYIQHPAYAANVLFAAASGLALTTWPSALVATALALAAHVPRIHHEEALLSQRFPNLYPAYHRQTGRFVPHTLGKGMGRGAG